MNKAVAFMLAFSFTFVLNGFDSILSFAFTPTSSHASKQLIQLNHVKTTAVSKTFPRAAAEDYASLIMSTDLHCISDMQGEMTPSELHPQKSASFRFVDLNADLTAYIKKIHPVVASTATLEPVTSSMASPVPTQRLAAIAQDRSLQINPVPVIAMIGPAEPHYQPITDDGAGLDKFLVCDFKARTIGRSNSDQTMQDQFAFLTHLPGYLKKSLDGGLSKARFRPLTQENKALVQFSLPSKSHKTLLQVAGGSVFEDLIMHTMAPGRTINKHMEKSPVMSTGPPMTKEYNENHNPILHPSLVYSAYVAMLQLTAGKKPLHLLGTTGGADNCVANYFFDQSIHELNRVPSTPWCLGMAFSVNDINSQTTITG